jgi:C4-dicarboxylate-specific signal transduction histidine kinase
MTPTSLSDIVSETLDLCHARFANDDIKVYLAPLPPYWTVECRSSQISQVLLNLLNNAHDAILELKEKWIRVECADIGTAHTIRVTDSGTGIPPEVATKIMAPFFTTKPTGRGTGLGLSISSNILTDHGGWLIVDQEASNTSFVITIPKKQEGQLLQQAV